MIKPKYGINTTTPDDWNRLRAAHPAIEVASTVYDGAPVAPKSKGKPLLPVSASERKAIPVYTGFVSYFPRAIAAVSRVSLEGGIQHGQTPTTLHWDRSKSGDELDAMMRHILDKDWAQVAWRAMANLEKQLEAVASK